MQVPIEYGRGTSSDTVPAINACFPSCLVIGCSIGDLVYFFCTTPVILDRKLFTYLFLQEANLFMRIDRHWHHTLLDFVPYRMNQT